MSEITDALSAMLENKGENEPDAALARLFLSALNDLSADAPRGEKWYSRSVSRANDGFQVTLSYRQKML